MKIDGNTIRPGMVIEHQGKLWRAVKIAHTQPGKGGAYMQVELRNLEDGSKLNERFRSAESVERVRLDEKEYQYLYAEGDLHTLMDAETYEQLTVNGDLFGEEVAFLQDGMAITVMSHEGRPLSAAIPASVILEVVEADPVVKGQTAAASYKPAMLENGVRVSVPPFVGTGDRIVVNTVERTYVERAKD
ncbi:MAG: elongation factor P [Rhodospirillaceae bacterium]|jgi:elongation factor P|nr:elongation factor P [Rhodospirillaceae bacterium]